MQRQGQLCKPQLQYKAETFLSNCPLVPEEDNLKFTIYTSVLSKPCTLCHNKSSS